MYAPERGGGDYLNLIVNAFAMRLLTRLIIVVDREVDSCLNCSIFILLKHWVPTNMIMRKLSPKSPMIKDLD